MNKEQIQQKAKELLIQNCGTPTFGDNGEMTADLDYYIESDAALSTMIEFAEWMAGEWDRLRECSNARKNEILRLRESLDELAEEVERLKGERQWISVKDRLPEEGGRYWCYVRELTDLGYSHFQWNCAYNAKEKRFSDSTLTNGENVTHWMKLPEPPKPQTEHE